MHALVKALIALAAAAILTAVVVAFMTDGPLSLRAQYALDVSRDDAAATDAVVVCDQDLANLPEPVRRYLRLAQVVGQPRVRNFSASMHGTIRQGSDSPWMALSAEQHNDVDMRTRYFYMTSSMFGLPVRGYHRYAAGSATMQVKVAGLITVASASGKEMTQAETVTLLNDMAVLAPATLIDPAIVWEPLNSHRARATLSTGANTIRADLVFNDAGELVNFISDDRYQVAADGTPRAMRWSTPLSEYKVFGHARLASRGAGRWHDGHDVYSYVELTIDDVRYNRLP